MIRIAKRVRGMTLVEMMVAIGILVMATGGFTLLYIRSLQTHAFTIEEGMTALANSRAVDGVIDELRRVKQGDNGDFPLVSVGDTDVIVYLNVDDDAGTERVHYFLEGTTLKRGITDPIVGTTVLYPSGDATVNTLATSVVNTADEPVFSYYNKQYPGDTAHNPLSGAIVLSDIRLIRVWLSMNIDPRHAPNNIAIESFAELRNLNDY
jgi:hypothetical protein